MQYVVIQGKDSGMFSGYLAGEQGQIVCLKECRRLLSIGNIPSLSELALNGVTDPSGCQFCEPVPDLKIMDCIEMIPCSGLAQSSIIGQPDYVPA